MRSIRTILVLIMALLVQVVCLQAQDIPSNKEKFHLYLLIGQSNMAGRGKLQNASEKGHVRVFSLDQEGKWVQAQHPLHFDKPDIVGVGPGLSFGNAMVEADPDVTIGLIPCAVGGSSIKTWTEGGYHSQTRSHPYDDALKRARIALQNGTLKGIIWHQGESDSKPEDYPLHAVRLQNMIASLRHELNAPDLPFVAATLPSFFTGRNEWGDSINQVLMELPFEVTATACVSSQGLHHNGDTIHFDAPSAEELGKRYAKAMQSVQLRKSTINRPRVIISTDIGGSDPDDYQSLVHLLMYADRLQLEGLIASPPHAGRTKHIEEVIGAYRKDLAKLMENNSDYPSADELIDITKQGATEVQSTPLPDHLSEGARHIVEKAGEFTPLFVLVWGSITDVAQAVHYDPSIKESLRVYSIGSWNTRQDSLARNYLFEQHPDLWWVESNTTFRGMYMGGNQSGNWGNESFVEAQVKPYGALGKLFWEKKNDIKMGDTPSVFYLLSGDPLDPTGPGWGGSYIATDHGPNYWTDNPDPSLIENNRPGAKTVNQHRQSYLADWAVRMKWLKKN